MTTEFPTSTNGTTGTLAGLMAAEKIEAPEALRRTMQLAQALRVLHESGRIHGAVSPSKVSVAGAAWNFVPAEAPEPFGAYTAPEVLEGRRPDERSDIFGLGCILYELVAGRPAFSADSPSAPPSCGNPALDRVLAGCLATNPEARYQKVQKLILELKILTVGLNRAASPAPLRPQQMEERIAARLDIQERTMSEALEAVNRRVSQVEEVLNACDERTRRLELSLEALRSDAATLRGGVATDIAGFERVLQGQSAVIESARTALAQTDDLVERVVEALDSLQSMVLEHAGEPEPGSDRR